MKKRILALFVWIIMVFVQIQPQITTYAKEESTMPRAYDTYSKEHSKSLSYTKTMVSISPSNAAATVPSDVKTVSFRVNLKGSTQYDRLTGKYVSASSPTATLEYQGKVALTCETMSTSYRDNGNTITFYFSGRLKGTTTSDMGVVCSIDYGTISGDFTVNK